MPINIDSSDIQALTIDGEDVTEVTKDGEIVWPQVSDIDITNITVKNGVAGGDVGEYFPAYMDTGSNVAKITVDIENKGSIGESSVITFTDHDGKKDTFSNYYSPGETQSYTFTVNHGYKEFAGPHYVDISHSGGGIDGRNNPARIDYGVERYPYQYLISDITDTSGSTVDVEYVNIGQRRADMKLFNLGGVSKDAYPYFSAGNDFYTARPVNVSFSKEKIVNSTAGDTITADWTPVDTVGSYEGERDSTATPQGAVFETFGNWGWTDGDIIEYNPIAWAQYRNTGDVTGNLEVRLEDPDSSHTYGTKNYTLSPGQEVEPTIGYSVSEEDYGESRRFQFVTGKTDIVGPATWDVDAADGTYFWIKDVTIESGTANTTSDVIVTIKNIGKQAGTDTITVSDFDLAVNTSIISKEGITLNSGEETTVTASFNHPGFSSINTGAHTVAITSNRDSRTESYTVEESGASMQFTVKGTGEDRVGIRGQLTNVGGDAAGVKAVNTSTNSDFSNSFIQLSPSESQEVTLAITKCNYYNEIESVFDSDSFGVGASTGVYIPALDGPFFYIENVNTSGGTEKTDSTIDVSLRNIGKDSGTSTVTVSDPDHANGASPSKEITLNSGATTTSTISVSHPSDGTVNLGTHNISVTTDKDSVNSSYTIKESTKFEITSFSATGGMATAVDNNHRTTVTNTGGVAGEVSISYDNPKVNGYTTTLSAGSHVNFNKLDGRGWTSETGGQKSLRVSTQDDSATASYTVEPVPADITMEILETDDYPLGIKAEIENVGGQTVDMEVRNQSDNDHRFEDTNNDRVMTMPPGQIRTITLPHHDCVYYNRIRVYFVNGTGEYANGASRGVYVRSAD